MDRTDFYSRVAAVLFLRLLRKMDLTKRKLKYYRRSHDFQWEK